MGSEPPTRVILQTGLQTLLHRTLAQRFLEEPKTVLYVVLCPGHSQELEALSDGLSKAQEARLHPVEGDVASMNLGLEGDTYRKLTTQITEIHHTAEEFSPRGAPEAMEGVNVEGTREVLELAGACTHLQRFCHWSTVWVSGDTEGVVMEDELAKTCPSQAPYRRSKWMAERLVRRWARRLPVTILRPGIPACHSRSGELDTSSPLMELLTRILAQNSNTPLNEESLSRAPLHIVPVDYLAQAGNLLAARGGSKTYHLVDPSPLSLSRFYELARRKAHRPPRATGGSSGMKRLLRFGWLPRPLIRALKPLKKVEEPHRIPTQRVLFNHMETLKALTDTDVRCPPVDSYTPKMVRWVEQTLEKHSSKPFEAIPDPLD